MLLHNSHFENTRLRSYVIEVIFIVVQHIFVNHFPFSLKIHSVTYIISFLLKRGHIIVFAHHCLLILNTKQQPCSHCARTFSCDSRQLSKCRAQVHVFNQGFQVTEVKLCEDHSWLAGHDIKEISKICGLIIISALQGQVWFTNSL